MAKKKAADPYALYRSVGGKQVSFGTRKSSPMVWDFGWTHESKRTDAQQVAHHKAVGEMPRFRIDGKSLSEDSAVTEALLYKLWTHPHVVEANGYAYPGNRQVTGSCVGVSYGNIVMTLACVEAITLGEPEVALIPFWLLSYGRGRYYGGSRSPGEGSQGSTQAKAAREDGDVPAKTAGLPTWTTDDMLCWGKSAELSWSDGDAQQTMALLPQSRRHLVKTTAQCADHNDVREALVNGYPCTAASMYAHNGGRVQGNPPVLLAKRGGSWSHQMGVIAWMEHPQFGELFYLMNQWGKGAHGQDPFGAPLGGVWITSSDMDYICRDEVFAYSQRQGYPAPAPDKIPWIYL